MRPPSRLVLVASLCGAAAGAYSAFRLSNGGPQSAATPRIRSVAVGIDEPPTSVSSAPERQGASVPSAPAAAAAPAAPVDSQAEERSNPSRPEMSSGRHLPSPPPVASAPPPEAHRPSARAMSLVAWTPADDPTKSLQLCTVGEAGECLRLAEMHAHRTQSLLDSKKAQAYRERAYSLLVLQCHQRNPDACVTIARMHALGFGLPKNPASEEALIGRARDLCKYIPATVCSAFAP